jgi:hypothetical protein
MYNKLIFCACVLTEMWTNSVDSWFSLFLGLFPVYQVLICVEASWHCGMPNIWKWWYTKLPMSKWSLNWKQLWQSPLAAEIILSTIYLPFSNVVRAEVSSLLRCHTVSKDHVSNWHDVTSQKTWICNNTTERTSNLAIRRLLLVPF